MSEDQKQHGNTGNQYAAKEEGQAKDVGYSGRAKREDKAAWVACAQREGYKNLNELITETMNDRCRKYRRGQGNADR